jgi:hypothetical protein
MGCRRVHQEFVKIAEKKPDFSIGRIVRLALQPDTSAIPAWTSPGGTIGASQQRLD